MDNSTWGQEQAFAEDSGGLFGELVWPPRSYSCSFCGREFKSAQALGGHMNVHRRDRARLKQQQQQQQHVNNSNPNSHPTSIIRVLHNNNSSVGVETNLSMGLNLEYCLPRVLHVRCKRRKTTVRPFAPPPLLQPSSSNGLDLELRLGNSSKVIM